ncbi:MAG TPA: hypothetical protein VHI13_13960 [Candidatus Kapabacteria bacterium]|nr:hypothetical protein [Candidatus Kapabacteria bacterium]
MLVIVMLAFGAGIVCTLTLLAARQANERERADAAVPPAGRQSPPIAAEARMRYLLPVKGYDRLVLVVDLDLRGTTDRITMNVRERSSDEAGLQCEVGACGI